MYTESRDKDGNLNKHQLHHKSLVGLIGYTKNYPFWTKVEVTASIKTVKLIGVIHTETIVFKTNSVFMQYINFLEDYFNVDLGD